MKVWAENVILSENRVSSSYVVYERTLDSIVKEGDLFMENDRRRKAFEKTMML